MMNLLHQTSFVLRAQKLWMCPLKWNQPLLCQCFCKGQFWTDFSSWHLELLFVVGEWWRVKRWIPPCLRSQLCSFHSSSYLACSKGCKLLEGIIFTSVKGFGTINQAFLFLLLHSYTGGSMYREESFTYCSTLAHPVQYVFSPNLWCPQIWIAVTMLIGTWGGRYIFHPLSRKHHIMCLGFI